MNKYVFVLGISLMNCVNLWAQNAPSGLENDKAIHDLIDRYSLSRESRDTSLLREIVTADIDQLVSTGEWRKGIGESIDGMMRSSSNNPGKRTIIIDRIRHINPGTAIVDARYEIQNADGTTRKMWSTFIVVKMEGKWKITAIRNMLPAR